MHATLTMMLIFHRSVRFVGLRLFLMTAIIALLLAMGVGNAEGSAIPRCLDGIVPKERVSPGYPTDTFRDGWVLVEFVILTSGKTEHVRVIESSSRIFERSAIWAIRQWQYAVQVRPCIRQERLTYVAE